MDRFFGMSFWQAVVSSLVTTVVLAGVGLVAVFWSQASLFSQVRLMAEVIWAVMMLGLLALGSWILASTWPRYGSKLVTRVLVVVWVITLVAAVAGNASIQLTEKRHPGSLARMFEAHPNM